MSAVLRAENRAAVLHGVRDLRIEPRPVPAPAAREVLVEIAWVGVCGSDVHYFERGRIGNRVVRSPLVLGHEASGRVVGRGAKVTRHRIGDRVCLEPGIPCRRCRECLAGRYNLCSEMRFLGTPPVDGALTKFLAVPEEFAFALPDSISDEAGALIEPLAVAVWACRKAAVGAGEHVLVTGTGPIGLLVAATARALGATEVTISDLVPERLEAAARLGSARTVNVATTEIGSVISEVDALIECSGSPAALADSLPLLRPAGMAVVVGMGEDELRLPLDLIQRREIWVTGTFRYANVYPAAIALAAEGRVDLEGIITRRFGLEQTAQALVATHEDPGAVKAVVSPSA